MPTYSGKFAALPQNIDEFMNWSWEQIEPFYADLKSRRLDQTTVQEWLLDWTRLSELIDEVLQRLYVATTRNTADEVMRQRYEHFIQAVYPATQAAEQPLKQKLLDSHLSPPHFEIILRNMRADADLFREANLPLLAEEQKLISKYDQIFGSQTVEWDGEVVPLVQMSPQLQVQDRTIREKAWRLMIASRQANRDAYNDLWQRFMTVRRQIARNADLPDFRAYRWRQMYRFDYTPDDCKRFAEAIEEVVVPVTKRLAEERRTKLNIETLRPWDMDVDPDNLPPLRPFTSIDELEAKMASIFNRIDPQLGAYFETMRRENLLDLGIRQHKAGGGYCTTFVASRRPFIFANSNSEDGAVLTLLHEGGHAFHVFESAPLPYFQQRVERQVPSEFAEVASTSMEFIGGRYLAASEGGFYSSADTARSIRKNLYDRLFFWPYMAVVDLFQHWVYEHQEAATDPAQCDAKWQELYRQFCPHEDWRGLEQEQMTGWHRKLHIFQSPLYFVEYGMAQLGAIQVWQNALQDQAAALRRYRQALALGGSASLPQLYEAAGARFAFDTGTVQEAVLLIEQKLAELKMPAQ